MHINVTGSGPDVVLLHGWGMYGGVWDEFAALLAPQFRVHSVDLPGHGRSAACTPYTLDAMVDALVAACPPCATVCGWSLGGLAALRWAVKRRTQVKRLVLIASTPRFVRDADWECGMALETFEDFAGECARDPDRALQRFAMLQAQGDTAARAVARRLRECSAAHAVNAATLAAGLQILRETDLRDELPQIDQPALILHGEFDTLVPPAAGEYLHRHLTGSQIHALAGAAHAPFIARPQAAAHRIAEFCLG